MSDTQTTAPSRTLEKLWQRYLATGDEDVMERIVESTRPRLLAAARRIGRAGDAEDCVQSAYLSLLRRGAAVRDVPVYPWLLTAVIRLAYRRQARERREAELARRLAVPGRLSREVRDELGGDETDLLRRAVEELPDTYRDAVALHYFQGLSTRETAQVLAIEPNTLRVRLHRARAILRERWGRRTAYGLLLLPLAVRDRLRMWSSAGFVGSAGLLQLPGLAAAVLLAALGLGSGLTAAAMTEPARAPETVAVDVPGPSGGAEESESSSDVDERDATKGEAAEGDRFVVEDHYLNGALKTRREVVRLPSGEELADGLFEAWRVDGSRESVGRKVRGKRSGKWTYFYETGQKAEEGAFEEDEETGRWIEWAENGVKIGETEYAGGLRHGAATEWHENGTKRAEGKYVRGDEEGLWKRWFDDDHLKGHLYEKCNYVAGEKHGEREVFGTDGSRLVEEYAEDERHGTVVRHFASGSVQSSTAYRQGVLHGKAVTFFEGGRKQTERQYVDGILIGPDLAWHPNGLPASSGSWARGRQHGAWTYHNEAGVKVRQMTYEEGNLLGPQILWNDAGVKVHETRFGFKAGESRSFRLWYDDGSPALEWRWGDDRDVRRAWDREGRAYQAEFVGQRAKEGEFLEVHSIRRVRTRLRTYTDFELDGPERRWGLDGTLLLEGSWLRGKQHGRWRSWSKDGELLSDETWADGVRVAVAGPSADAEGGSATAFSPHARFSFDFRKVKACEVIEYLANDAGLTLSLGPEVRKRLDYYPVTLRVNDVSLPAALDLVQVYCARRFRYSIEDGVLSIR